MDLETRRDPRFLCLVSEFPLRRIEDDREYHAAIHLLDRLFALDDRRTPSELAYFRALAKLAYEYESRRLLCEC